MKMLNSTHEYAPNVDDFTIKQPAPLVADAKGESSVPQPGIVTKTEY